MEDHLSAMSARANSFSIERIMNHGAGGGGPDVVAGVADSTAAFLAGAGAAPSALASCYGAGGDPVVPPQRSTDCYFDWGSAQNTAYVPGIKGMEGKLIDC